ncbi:MAG: methylmalonyl Co-A mutase-associated GTPase MeaB [Thermodesulfobacteriota bacterium]|nr:methylmalonyl Co-A mutase-associated GTPase MeaB [Thermodesulfobacteriota bacterium]
MNNSRVDEAIRLVEELKKGSIRGLSKLITLVENDLPGARNAMETLYPLTGKSCIIGITGSPGVGKSTLTDRVTRELRNHNYSVGIIAVDPTSPFTGGALLGDRVRMQDISRDEEVFIRSLATRGSLGGLSRSTADVIKVMDAFGKDFIIVETVGVGQDEIDIVKTADVTIVTVIPGAGDEIQTIKAGIMEIGDIFVVNKGDRSGADKLVAEIQSMVAMGNRTQEWIPPVVSTIAVQSEGVAELVEKIFDYRRFQEEKDILDEKRKERSREEITNMIEYEISKYVHKILQVDLPFEEILDDIVAKKKNPYSLVKEVVEPFAKAFEKGMSQ